MLVSSLPWGIPILVRQPLYIELAPSVSWLGRETIRGPQRQRQATAMLKQEYQHNTVETGNCRRGCHCLQPLEQLVRTEAATVMILSCPMNMHHRMTFLVVCTYILAVLGFRFQHPFPPALIADGTQFASEGKRDGVILWVNGWTQISLSPLWCVHKCHIEPGPRFNIKMPSYQYRKSHCGDKTVVRSSYLHNGISYTGKMASLYWIRAQVMRRVGPGCQSQWHHIHPFPRYATVCLQYFKSYPPSATYMHHWTRSSLV